MKKITGYLVILIGLILVIWVAFYFRSEKTSEPIPVPQAATTTESTSTKVLPQSEDSTQNAFRNQPGAIRFIEQIGEGEYWSLTVDLLSPNRAWIPGGSNEQGGFFLNQNTKLRDLTITADTAAYRCDGPNATRRVGAATFIDNVQDIIQRSKTDQGMVGEFGYTAYFDIDDTDILTIYEQCLP